MKIAMYLSIANLLTNIGIIVYLYLLHKRFYLRMYIRIEDGFYGKRKRIVLWIARSKYGAFGYTLFKIPRWLYK